MSENLWVSIWVPWSDGDQIYWLVRDDVRPYPRIPYQGDQINAIDDDEYPLPIQISQVYMANNGLVELIALESQPLKGEITLRLLEEAGYINGNESSNSQPDNFAIWRALLEGKRKI